MSRTQSKPRKTRKQPPKLFQRWSRKTLTIVGAAVLAGFTATITAVTTGLINTSVSNIRGALSTPSSTLAVNVKTVGVECGPNTPCDYSAVFQSIYKPPEETLRQLAADPAGNITEVRRSFTRAGAAYPGRMLITLQVRNQSKHEVRIINVRVVRLKSGSIYNGTFLSLPPQGDEETRQVVFDMDRIIPFAEDLQTGKPFFTEKVITLQPDEEETFKISAFETKGSTRYKLALDYRTEGQDGTMMTDDNGYPFSLSAFVCVAPEKARYVNAYELGQGPLGYTLYKKPGISYYEFPREYCPKANYRPAVTK
jgi:hypothetical protein